MKTAMKDYVTYCTDCRYTCLQTMQQCLEKGGKLADAKLCMMLVECAQYCQVCADGCSTGSERSNDYAKNCAKICEETASYCERMNEPSLAKCIETLKACAKYSKQYCEKAVA